VKTLSQALKTLAWTVLFGLSWWARPALGETPAAPKDFVAARRHWAYQPIHRPAPPPVRNGSLVKSPIDAFVLAQLEGKGLTLSPPADRRALIRRVYYDLIGLPPAYEVVEAFARDHSPEAYARLVDELLASPRYGERWGRHWLDVARYAETKDLVLLFGKDRLRPYAYTYRDYVIRAFNLDLPFDQFVREQLAADQVVPQSEPWRQAALGFLTLGRLYDNNPHDQIDDQIDTVSRAFLGLTVACARCHDHKYDAITSEDYYGLYGVFANSERPYDLPLIEAPERVPGGEAFEKKLAESRRKLQELIDAEYEKLSGIARDRVADYLVRIATSTPDISENSSFFLSLAPDDLRPGLVHRWRLYVEQRARPDDHVFGLWAKLMALPDEGFAARAREVVREASREGAGDASTGGVRLNPLVVKAFTAASPTNKGDAARIYGELLHRTYLDSKASSASATPRTPGPDERELLALVSGPESPGFFEKRQTAQHMSRVEADKFGGLVAELDKIAAYSTNAPPARAMVVADTPEIHEPHIFIRGSPARPGALAPRAFLRVLAGDDRKPFSHGSGRLDLARAITAPDNPLTARVIVNRVWMEHFGEPLVSSPNDFGTRSEPPAQPELLDYLAATLIEDGWSLKRLHRRIMLSATYQQSVQTPEPAKALGERVDPNNRLFWHFGRRRLDLEAMRDTLLVVSGRLDPTFGGRSVDVAGDPFNRRRTVYGLVDRQDLPAFFRAFDFAVPDQCVDRRSRTSVPQQALFAMNSPFIMEQARALAERTGGEATPADRIRALYRLALGRLPDLREVELGARFVHENDTLPAVGEEGQLGAWERFAQVLLMSNEMIFVE